LATVLSALIHQHQLALARGKPGLIHAEPSPRNILFDPQRGQTYWFDLEHPDRYPGMRLEAVLLVVAWASSMCSFMTKLVIRRPRPDNSLVRVVIAKTRDTSFPSGHVVHYTTFWGFVVYLLAIRGMFRPVGRLLSVAMVPIIALVGPSRVYLGHHWFTDVAGSYLLGSAYLAGLIEMHGIIRHEFGQPPEPSESGWTAGASQWLR
jgi:hypothetical protein